MLRVFFFSSLFFGLKTVTKKVWPLASGREDRPEGEIAPGINMILLQQKWKKYNNKRWKRKIKGKRKVKIERKLLTNNFCVSHHPEGHSLGGGRPLKREAQMPPLSFSLEQLRDDCPLETNKENFTPSPKCYSPNREVLLLDTCWDCQHISGSTGLELYPKVSESFLFQIVKVQNIGTTIQWKFFVSKSESAGTGIKFYSSACFGFCTHSNRYDFILFFYRNKKNKKKKKKKKK